MSRVKRVRGKRVFPVKYASDFINVTQRPRALVTDFRDSEGDHWHDNQARVRSVVGPKHQKEPKFNNTFQQEVPTTIGFIRDGFWQDGKKIPVGKTPKQAAMEVRSIIRMKEGSNSSRIVNIEEFHFIIIAKYRHRTTKLFFSGDVYIWVDEDAEKGTFKRSTEYIGKAQAMRVYQSNKVLWTAHGKLSKSK